MPVPNGILSIHDHHPRLLLTFFKEAAAICEPGIIRIRKPAISQIFPGPVVFCQYLVTVMR